MNKKIDDLKDIEAFFLKVEEEEKKLEPKKLNLKGGSKGDDKRIKSLERDLAKYIERSNKLEDELNSLKSNKSLGQRDSYELNKIFLGLAEDEFEDKESQKIIEKLKDEKRELIKENKRLSKIQEKQEKEIKLKSFKKTTYEEIVASMEKKYSFLSENSKVAIATAEYLYLNETHNQIDYTGAYVNYIKALEIELRRVYGFSSQKLTFGNLIKKLNSNSIFKSFVARIEHEKVIEVRNNAIHKRAISKHECGKVRKLLLEENWLDRISFLIEESIGNKEAKEIKTKVKIKNREGNLTLDGKNYIRYQTDRDIDLLSTKSNLSGLINIQGFIKIYNGEEFIISTNYKRDI